MATMLNGTMETAKHILGSARGTSVDAIDAAKSALGSARDTSASAVETAVDAAKSAVETAKDGTGHAVSSARSTLMDGVHAITGVATMLRNLQADDALGWVGLARRRNPLVSLAVFGAGFAAGAGAGLLLAPTSGAELRKSIFKSFQGLLGDAKEVAETAEAKVEKIEGKAEKLAGKAKDKAEDLAGKAKDKAEDLASKAKDVAGKVEDKVETKAAAAVNAVKDTVNDAKSMVAASTDPAHDSHLTNETNKPARTQSGANQPS